MDDDDSNLLQARNSASQFIMGLVFGDSPVARFARVCIQLFNLLSVLYRHADLPMRLRLPLRLI